MHALSRLGLKVPDDVALIGYDSIKLSKYFDLTTVDQKMYTIGQNAIKRIVQLIEGDESLMQKTITSEIVQRGSTAG